MSDYWPEEDGILPLFSACREKEKARAFHERDEAQANVLASLRRGDRILRKESESDGSRIAPAIEQLRNAHGFSILGNGTEKKPYLMPDVGERPSLARVTDEMKAAYSSLPHWIAVKNERHELDGHVCVLCRCGDDLRCHHISYERLFGEPMCDLLTLCADCHDRVHENCRLKFPSGISVQYAHLLGWKGFETWLLP
jgi:hypothetical protein